MSSDPRQKERHEDDPVEQVVDSLNNAIDDLELADSELDKDLEEINISSGQPKPASGIPSDQKDDNTVSSQTVPSSQSTTTSSLDDNNHQDSKDNSLDQNSTAGQIVKSETRVYERSNDDTSS